MGARGPSARPAPSNDDQLEPPVFDNAREFKVRIEAEIDGWPIGTRLRKGMLWEASRWAHQLKGAVSSGSR
jgi:hypothetical protein